MGEFALFDLGQNRIGIATQHVVQAVAYPQNITQLPRARNALEGVFMHRGQMVPLVDLLRWIDPQSQHRCQSQQVLVLRADDKVIAILVDAIKGLLRAPDAHVSAVHHDADALEFFHSVVLAEDGVTLIGLLDPLRLATQAKVWAGSAAPQGVTGPGMQTSGQRAAEALETVAVVRLGNTQLALPAVAVGEVLTGAVVQTMRGLGREFIGMTRWRGADIPVINLAALLALPELEADSPKWLVVLHFEDRTLAFYVHEICTVGAFDTTGLQTESGLPDAMKALCLGTYVAQTGERVAVLNARAVLAAIALSQRAPSGAAARESGTLQLAFEGHAGASALVVFKSRQLWAAPMQGMREIITMPTAFQNLSDTNGAVLGSMEWRGQAIALVDLRKTFDAQRSALTENTRVVVVEQDERFTAWVVEGVSGLIPAHSGTRSRFTTQGALVEMVTVGDGAAQQSYQLMDFNQALRSVSSSFSMA